MFLSRNLLLPSASFTEVALKLAVLSLPAESGSPSPHGMQSTPDGLRVTAGTPLILCHKELAECPLERDRTLVVARHYTEASTGGGRPGRPDEVRLERPDKLLARRPYKVTVVVTNAGTATRRVRVLSQIPAGSVPLGRVKELESSVITVQPYRTADFSYHVYFPEEGAFAHFPAHLSSVDRASAALGCTPAEDLVVSVRHALVDKRNWRDVALVSTPSRPTQLVSPPGHPPPSPGPRPAQTSTCSSSCGNTAPTRRAWTSASSGGGWARQTSCAPSPTSSASACTLRRSCGRLRCCTGTGRWWRSGCAWSRG